MKITFEDVFTYKNLYEASRKCRLGVGWKASTQRYLSEEICNVSKLYNDLHSGKYRALPFGEFDLYERGKARHIKSCHIKDRVVQKCFCENCLLPALMPSLIYDNGACMKDKGIHFARNRLKTHLMRFYRKHKTNGYVLVFDFKSYFDSIPHDLLIEMVGKKIQDKRLLDLYAQLVNDFGGGKGLGLGSQISQISAIYFLNGFDHFIKERLKIKFYGRYMDDGYLICHSKTHLKYCLQEMIKFCKRLKIRLNLKKTQIIKLTAGFNYLKQRWRVLESGRIIRTPCKKNIVRQRRKLKKLKAKLDKGDVLFENIKMSQQSWCACVAKINAKQQIFNMQKLFNSLFELERSII